MNEREIASTKRIEGETASTKRIEGERETEDEEN